MDRAAFGGLLYFGIVFATGFLLGTGRVLWLEPMLGKLNATLIELPIILGVAWVASFALIARLAVPADVGARLLMGGIAFALLMTAEAGLTFLLFGRGLGAFLLSLTSASELPGFLGQALFAFFPVLQLGLRRD